MREKEVEYEVEKTKTEVEKVYCDLCGVDCTDDHQATAMELCPSCREDDQTLLDWDEYKKKYSPDISKTEYSSLPFSFALFAVFFSPVVFFLVVLDAFDGDEIAKYILVGYFGGILWTVILFVAFLLI